MKTTKQITKFSHMNVFMILSGRRIYADPSGLPVQAFQMFVPGRKVDFLFGAN